MVLDTNVVVSAAFWPKSEDRRCLVLLARRKCRLAVTEVVLREYRALAARIGRRECPGRTSESVTRPPGGLLQSSSKSSIVELWN
jgi:predicted nucleic acid-binding protein